MNLTTMATAAAILSYAAAAPLLALPDFPDHLLYLPTNLLVDANVDRNIDLFRRARAAGYTGVLLADSKFSRLADLPDRYFANCRRLQAAADAEHLELIPAVFPIGYSNDLLSQDPNLAEALPVREATFIVRGNTATLDPDSGARFAAGDMGDLSKWTWHDPTVTADNGAARVTNPKGNNARLVQKLTLIPFRQYHVSVRIRTQEFRGTPEIKALATPPGGKGEAPSLLFSSLGVKPTQDWTVHHAVFNTLENSEVSIYLGCWDGSTGSLWWDDAAIEEVGLLNVVRRAGAPLTLSLEGAPTGQPGVSSPTRLQLIEGTDFEPIKDPDMGVHPWPGSYDIYHTPPSITLKKPLPGGTRLRVSYHHVVTVNDGQVMICPSEPRTVELLRDQARRMHDLWHARAYFMSHDEIRCLNQDESCRARNLTPGQILADNLRACTQILKDTSPGGRIYVWSDMFDPHHNAVSTGRYYLVRGDLTGSWDGLDKDTIVACWYFDRRADSMKFFADRGNPLLLAGYYDGPPGKGIAQIVDWLASVPPGATLRGVMYTTWEQRYKDLEAFAARAWTGRASPP